MHSDTHYRMTSQRRVILEKIKNMHSHPSADEIYVKVRQVLPHISLGTVYRNLEILSEMGLINKLEISGSQKRFDGYATNHHYHIRCMRCDRVDDAPCGMISDLEDRIVSESGYKVMGHRLEFVGLCSECQQHISSTDNKKALLI